MSGERRYRDALARLERLVADDPGREAEAYQFRGDLRLLLGDPAGAIAAYEPIEERFKHDEYVASALAHAGRDAEAAALLSSALADFPHDGKISRLGKLIVDATLLALETGDASLVRRAAAAMDGQDLARVEAPVRSAVAFARGARDLLDGLPLRADAFPLGEASPMWTLLAVRGHDDPEALARVRAATAPEAMHFGVLPSHIYPALWLERARLEATLGGTDAALAWLDRVIRPRHFDASRGAVIGPALALEARVLDAAGRGGEAEAVRRELARLHAP
ncbi:MAG: tetratricopeptide repeat protein [Kofleriaceae bacterium]|nr:tetratricopeptide repeat protein [Kofleriaceae bacterium]